MIIEPAVLLDLYPVHFVQLANLTQTIWQRLTGPQSWDSSFKKNAGYVRLHVRLHLFILLSLNFMPVSSNIKVHQLFPDIFEDKDMFCSLKFFRHLHNHTKLAFMALMPTLYSNI